MRIWGEERGSAVVDGSLYCKTDTSWAAGPGHLSSMQLLLTFAFPTFRLHLQREARRAQAPPAGAGTERSFIYLSEGAGLSTKGFSQRAGGSGGGMRAGEGGG